MAVRPKKLARVEKPYLLVAAALHHVRAEGCWADGCREREREGESERARERASERESERERGMNKLIVMPQWAGMRLPSSVYECIVSFCISAQPAACVWGGCMWGDMRRRDCVHHPHPHTHTRPTHPLMYARVIQASVLKLFILSDLLHMHAYTHLWSPLPALCISARRKQGSASAFVLLYW